MMTSGLLVSVRSAVEAEAALAGGATLIDVKEPSRGALGRADDGVIAGVISRVAGRSPVSAALGELIDEPSSFPGMGLSFVKWGLAGLGCRADWPEVLRAAIDELGKPSRAVAVAYADWQRAAAPPPGDVAGFAVEHRCGAFLIDTWRKDGTTLLDWMAPGELSHLIQRCRSARVRVAFAGSLGLAQIDMLRSLAPDWFAVRGAACQAGDRTAVVDSACVRSLVDAIRNGSHPASLASTARA